MSRIRKLPADVASRIAAGEVVERPASLVKELIENSLDAGALKIDIESEGAGRGVLRIADDGCGMDAADCAEALGRHATSKLVRLEDLQSLATFGFRGEALYAIAAVSKLTLTSALPKSKQGWTIKAEAGNIVSSSPAPAVAGTVVEAREIFFNTPARLKFLKSDSYERACMTAVIEEAALAHPEVRFAFKSEGRRSLHFGPSRAAGVAALRERLAAVLGSETGGALLTAEGERPGLKLTLFLSPLDGLAATRALQHWFVNKRPIESRLLQQALYKAYADVRPRDRHPVCVGFLELPPSAFDVNVHPGKREIRFHRERDIFELVRGLAAQALAKESPAAPLLSGLARYPAPPTSGARAGAPARGESVAEALLDLRLPETARLSSPAAEPRWFTPPYRFLGQIERTYLVFEAAGGLFMLDQHAAAERVLFERFSAEAEKGARAQKLMLPIPVELPASGVEKALERKEELRRLGFELEPFGKKTLHVLTAPLFLEKASKLQELVQSLVESVAGPRDALRETRHLALATVACKAAIKAHDPVSEAEALKLLEDLRGCAAPASCPHGRRSMLALNREELARRFDRPGAPPL